MLKYVDTLVGFSEIPDEITLSVNISGCPNHCKECHSSYLAQDIGEELTFEKCCELIESNKGITCFNIMGGDQDANQVFTLALLLEAKYQKTLKLGWYSGKQEFPELDPYILFRGIPFDYIKFGPYIPELGSLNNPNTNQKMYMQNKHNGKFIDITNKFWR